MKPQTTIQGTVCKPEYTQTGGGKTLCRFLLVEETPRGKSIYPVTAWGGLADAVCAMQGRQVLVTARIDDREYKDRHYIELVAEGVFLAAEAPTLPAYPAPPTAGPGQGNGTRPPARAQPTQRRQEEPPDELGDIPF